MDLITNFDEPENHFALLRTLGAGADELIFVSPYLSPNLHRLLAKLSISNVRRFRLITKLEPRSSSQLQTVEALKSLCLFFDDVRPDVEWIVSLAEPCLHGKIYIFLKESSPFAALISSANFTESGLRSNYEWGIAVRDREILSRIESSVSRLVVVHLGKEDIEALAEKKREYVTSRPGSEEMIDLDLSQLIDRPRVLSFPGGTTWIKPDGTPDEPVRVGDQYAEPERDLHFSKIRPAGVAVGHRVVVYGVGAHRLLSVYEVTGPPAQVTPEEIRIDPWKERWPWYVPARNLTSHFGSNWWHHNLYLRALVDEYLAAEPLGKVTAAGGRTVGALNRGSDKIRLDPFFAHFILERITQSDGMDTRVGHHPVPFSIPSSHSASQVKHINQFVPGISVDNFLSFVGSLEEEVLETRAGRSRFTVRVVDKGLEITPLSTRKPREHRRAFVQRVLDRFRETGSWNTSSYQFTVNASYQLALIHRFLLHRGKETL